MTQSDETANELETETQVGRPFSELREAGLLWLINASVFHPRGLGLALHFDADGKATGWSLIYAGDGEPFGFPDTPEIAALFRDAETTIAEARMEPLTEEERFTGDADD